jgi:hypothetical protein
VVAPPPPVAYLAGQKLYAGRGLTSVLPSLDFETYSEAGYTWDFETNKWVVPDGARFKGIKAVGSMAYLEHPTAKVLKLSYDLKDGLGMRRWEPGMPNPQELFNHIANGGLLSGWNVSFEYWVWNIVCTKLYGWPPLDGKLLRCTMAKSRAFAMPGSLEDAGHVIGSVAQKDKRGKALLDRFSVPRNPTKGNPNRRITLEEDPLGSE